MPAKRLWGWEPTTSARQQRLTCTTSGHAAPAALYGYDSSSPSFPCGRCLQLHEISEKLAEHMAREGLQGRTVTLKLKSALTFEVRIQSMPTTACHYPDSLSAWNMISILKYEILTAQMCLCHFHYYSAAHPLDEVVKHPPAFHPRISHRDERT